MQAALIAILGLAGAVGLLLLHRSDCAHLARCRKAQRCTICMDPVDEAASDLCPDCRLYQMTAP